MKSSEDSISNESACFCLLVHPGESLDNLGNYSQAIPYLDKALAIDPNYKEAVSGVSETPKSTIFAAKSLIHPLLYIGRRPQIDSGATLIP